MLGDGPAAEQPERNGIIARFPDPIRTGVKREEVGAEFSRPRKIPATTRGALARDVLDSDLPRGGGDHPVRRHGDAQLVGRPQIRLVETGEQAVGIVGPQIAVQIGATILLVDEAAQTGAGRPVFLRVIDLDDVRTDPEILTADGDEEVIVVRFHITTVDGDPIDRPS